MDWNDCLHRIEAQTASLHPKISPEDFRHTLLISPRHNYVFANNPKVACTTIRKLLIDAEYGEIRPFPHRAGTIHYNNFLPFLSIWQMDNFPEWVSGPGIFTFCFVRNPYTRLLSGYLNKVAGGEAQKMNILEPLGLADQPDAEVSFETFIETVCALPVDKQDPHWRVQYYQTCQAGINYNFIGRFENLEADLRTVANHIGITNFITEETFGSVGQNGRSHATNAGSLLKQYYTPELCALVQDGFREDFEHFGYDKNLPG